MNQPPDPYDPGSFSDYDLEQLRPYKPIHPRGTNWKKIAERIWAPIAVVIGLAVKFGIFAIKFFGLFISIGAYALLWGWKFGVGITLLILVHELGHYIEARRQGLHPSLPMLIPFFGGAVLFRRANDPWRGALVSLAGPFAGALGAAACWGIGSAYDSNLFRALGYFGFFLNLFNLVPVPPLDGGHVVAEARLLAHAGTYNDRPSRGRANLVWALYIGLALVLVFCMWQTHVPQHRL